MNQDKSVLQQKYPLSPKKFWKKLIPRLFSMFLSFVLIAVVYSFIAYQFVATGGNSIPSWLISLVSVFIPVIILVCYALLLFVYVWYIKEYIKRYYYDANESFITIKKGVFTPTEIHVQWQKIQDVYVDQDLLDRIMGLYDVHIASATVSSGIEAHIDGVEKESAEALKQILLGKVSNSGQGFVNTTDSSVSTQTAPSAKTTLNLSEEISNKTYPLEKNWYTVSIIGRVVGSLLFPFIVTMGIFSKTINDSGGFNVAIVVFIGLAVFIFILQMITLWLWLKNYAFNFTPEHIYFREGVISISETHMPYSSIQDVLVTQGFWERIFGLARVIIQNATAPVFQVNSRGQQVGLPNGVTIQGLRLSDANKITDILKTQVLGKNTARHGL